MVAVLGVVVLVLGAALLVLGATVMLVLPGATAMLGFRVGEEDDDFFFLGGEEAKWTPPALAMASWLQLRPLALVLGLALWVPVDLVAPIGGEVMGGGCDEEDEETDDSPAVGLDFESRETR